MTHGDAGYTPPRPGVRRSESAYSKAQPQSDTITFARGRARVVPSRQSEDTSERFDESPLCFSDIERSLWHSDESALVLSLPSSSSMAHSPGPSSGSGCWAHGWQPLAFATAARPLGNWDSTDFATGAARAPARALARGGWCALPGLVAGANACQRSDKSRCPARI